MEDLSLHILDIAENSLRAGAKRIYIRLLENKHDNILVLEIKDDGAGMEQKTLKNASNPFFTTKDGKKFGLGLALLSQAAEEVGGKMKVEKRWIKGTKIIAVFNKNHIDMKPIGNIEETLLVLRTSHPGAHFSFKHIIKNGDSL